MFLVTQDGDGGLGAIRQFENRIDRLPATLQRLQIERSDDTTVAEQAREQITRPFKHQTALIDTRAAVTSIAARMAAHGKPPTAAAETSQTSSTAPPQQRTTFVERVDAIAEDMNTVTAQADVADTPQTGVEESSDYTVDERPAAVRSRPIHL